MAGLEGVRDDLKRLGRGGGGCAGDADRRRADVGRPGGRSIDDLEARGRPGPAERLARLDHRAWRRRLARPDRGQAGRAEGVEIETSWRFEGHASLLGVADLGDDVVAPRGFRREPGAHRGGRGEDAAPARRAAPVGVWDEIVEDARGLCVRGRIADGRRGARRARR